MGVGWDRGVRTLFSYQENFWNLFKKFLYCLSLIYWFLEGPEEKTTYLMTKVNSSLGKGLISQKIWKYERKRSKICSGTLKVKRTATPTWMVVWWSKSANRILFDIWNLGACNFLFLLLSPACIKVILSSFFVNSHYVFKSLIFSEASETDTQAVDATDVTWLFSGTVKKLFEAYLRPC